MPGVIINSTVGELCDELEAQGFTIDREVAGLMWDQMEVRKMRGGLPETAYKLHDRLDPEMFKTAQAKGISLSELLEQEDPTPFGGRDEALGIDAFARQMALLRTPNGAALRLWPERGTPAHSVEDMWLSGPKLAMQNGREVHAGKVLFYELCLRAADEGEKFGLSKFMNQKLFYSSSVPLWAGLNPQYLTGPVADEPRFRRPLLNELIAISSTVAAGEFRFPQIEDQAAQQHYSPVGEGANVPLVKLTVSTKSGTIHKFGIGVMVTDEVARRTPIDWIRYHFARIGMQNAEDKTQVVVELIFSSATNTNISTVGGAAGVVTSTPLDNFLGLFEEDGYVPTHAIAQRATATILKNAHTGTANQSVFRGPNRILSGGGTPEELDHPAIYSRTYATADKVGYVDSTRAIGSATEANSDKEETDRNIRNGTNLVVMTEVTGFHPIDTAAMRTLDVQN